MPLVAKAFPGVGILDQHALWWALLLLGRAEPGGFFVFGSGATRADLVLVRLESARFGGGVSTASIGMESSWARSDPQCSPPLPGASPAQTRDDTWKLVVARPVSANRGFQASVRLPSIWRAHNNMREHAHSASPSDSHSFDGPPLANTTSASPRRVDNLRRYVFPRSCHRCAIKKSPTSG